MRFSLRSLLIAIALVAAFLGGRASLSPLMEQHQREKIAFESQLKSLADLRPKIGVFKQYEDERRERLEAEVRDLQDRLSNAKAELNARFSGQLAFPVNTERAMIGDALNSGERQ